MNSECNISTGRPDLSGLRRFPVDKFYRKLLVLVPAGIIGNAAYCLLTTDRQAVAAITHFHPGYLVCAALLSVVPWFTGSLRLFAWSRFLGLSVRYRDAFRIAVSADLGAAVAPPMVGGGAVKVGMLMNRGVETGTALSLPVLENLEDGMFFLIMVPLALTVSSSWDAAGFNGILGLPRFSGTLAAASAAFCVLLLVPALWYGKRRTWLHSLRERIIGTFRTFLETFRLIGKRGKKVLGMTLFLTALQWICRYSIISLLLAGLGIPVRPVLFVALQVFVFALTALVPSPGGAGGAEMIFSFIYAPFLPAGTTGVATTGWRFFTFYFHTLLAALLTLVFGPARTNERTGSRPSATADTPDSPFLPGECCSATYRDADRL